jgi:hypothetical protein
VVKWFHRQMKHLAAMKFFSGNARAVFIGNPQTGQRAPFLKRPRRLPQMP